MAEKNWGDHMDVKFSALATASVLGLSFFLSACSQVQDKVNQVAPQEKVSCAGTAVPNRYIVRYQDGRHEVRYFKNRTEMIEKFVKPNLKKLQLVERDQIIQLNLPQVAATSTSPNHWGYDRVGGAYAASKGATGKGVKVAVVDSGVETTHPSLAGQFDINVNEVPSNGIDDDKNGYIDDYYGYDFFVKSGNVGDGNGHGTHVAGIIAALNKDNTIMGLAPESKIVPLSFMSASGQGQISDAIMAIQYAVSRGAKVINASWGGSSCSQSLSFAIKDLEKSNVLFVSAAGNDGSDIDYAPEYPAAFNLPSQITVAAITSLGYMAYFSNYGVTNVHVAAPGSEIWSSYKGGTVRSLDGTSMATPFVTAAAALLWSYRPNATVQQIKRALLNTSVPQNYLFPVSSRGELNMQTALTALDSI